MKNNDLEHVFKIMKDIKYAMVTTLGSQPMARPMVLVTKESGDQLHFMTVVESNKVNEALASDNILVTFSDTANIDFVSVLGTCQVSQNKQKINELFRFVDNAFFTDGVDTKGLCLLIVNIEHVECWHCDKNIFQQGFEIIKKIVPGKKAKLTQRITVDL